MSAATAADGHEKRGALRRAGLSAP